MSRTISHYQIEEELGRGGMGVVYRAIDTRLGRAVALKTLATETAVDADGIRRFTQEARSASALNHPHIVTIYEADQAADGTFIAMELVDGTPLDRMLSSGPLRVPTALEYATQIASALEAAHGSGIVHRDIKPANIMITRDGRAKVLDFGLAKLFERPSAERTVTALATRAGVIMGTPAYMSPEQAEGRAVDTRSDIFSLGAVLYEMLSGRRPFAGDSDVRILTSILRDQPPRLKGIRADVPAAVEAIIDRALAKDPAARYQDAGALRADLSRAHAALTRPADAVWRRPALLGPIAVILVGAAAFGAWQAVQTRRASWVRNEAIPEIERLQNNEQFMQAVRRARDAERYAPEEIARVKQGWYPISFNTEPAEADVLIRNYLDLNSAWEPLGRTPLTGQALPLGYYRVRFSKAGYVPVEISSTPVARRSIVLGREGSVPPNMVMVAGGQYRVGVANPVVLPDFWLDKNEVSNSEFKRFVDAGGYRDKKYWKEPFRDGDRVLTFEEAVARFRDTTGMSAPAAWELGSYPEGQADLPVGGISWFEAAAFADFSGKSLPTIYEWYRAANPDELFSDILRLSNFDGKGPRKVGESGGLGPWGTVDMAGNVKEWCTNLVQGTALRFILGGAWDEPNYRYTETDAQDPWGRSTRYGVRLAKRLGAAGASGEPVARVYGDPKSVIPAPDALVDAYHRFYDYDRTPLNPRLDAVDDSSPYWRKERVSFDAAYSGERVPGNLFLPKNAAPPYQIVIVFPSGYALNARSSELLDYSRFDFIMRSGRAALYPVYQGTYERRLKAPASGPSERRDWHVQVAKDLFRSIDYLATRQEIDLERLGYYSLSWGAYFAPIPLALEPRIKAAVIAAGGLRFNEPPEVHPANFAPRVKVPVILINGKNDFQAPLESQQRLMELLGTPAEHKKHVVLEGGHVPNDFRGLVREALDWYDKYLGPVK